MDKPPDNDPREAAHNNADDHKAACEPRIVPADDFWQPMHKEGNSYFRDCGDSANIHYGDTGEKVKEADILGPKPGPLNGKRDYRCRDVNKTKTSNPSYTHCQNPYVLSDISIVAAMIV